MFEMNSPCPIALKSHKKKKNCIHTYIQHLPWLQAFFLLQTKCSSNLYVYVYCFTGNISMCRLIAALKSNWLVDVFRSFLPDLNINNAINFRFAFSLTNDNLPPFVLRFFFLWLCHCRRWELLIRLQPTCFRANKIDKFNFQSISSTHKLVE